jgi:hypothetical protein
MADLIAEGTYTGRVLNHGVQKTSNGGAMAVVAFGLKDDEGSKHTVYWRGSFAGGAREHTIKALMTMGLRNVNDLPKLAEPGSGCLDTAAELSLVIEHETGDDGKVYARVRWVNRGGAGIRNAIDKGEFTHLLAGTGIRDDWNDVAQKEAARAGGGETRTTETRVQHNRHAPAQNNARQAPPPRRDAPPDSQYDEIPF